MAKNPYNLIEKTRYEVGYETGGHFLHVELRDTVSKLGVTLTLDKRVVADAPLFLSMAKAIQGNQADRTYTVRERKIRPRAKVGHEESIHEVQSLLERLFGSKVEKDRLSWC
jgi:hypothetical protein